MRTVRDAARGAAMLAAIGMLAAVPGFAAGQAPAAADWQRTLDGLRELVAGDRCAQALERIAELSRERPDDPDLPAIEANCVVNGARTMTRTFNQVRHDRMLVGLGAERLSPGQMRAMFDVEVSFDRRAVRRALRLLDRARRLAPERGDLVVGSVAVMAQVGRLRDAVELLERRAADLKPADLRGLRGVVEDLVRLRRTDDARSLAAVLGRLFPGQPQAVAAVVFAELEADAVDAALAARRTVPALPPEAQGLDHRLARRLLLARRWADAVPLLVPLAPGSPVVGAWLGIARERIARGSGASVWSAVARQLRSHETQAPRALGRLVEHYRRSAGDDRPVTIAMRDRATTFFLERDLPVAAIAEADAAIATAPDDPRAWRALARVLRREALFDEAFAAIDRAARLASGELAATIERERGELLFALGRDREAARALDAAAAAGAPDPFARGLVALALGEREEAIGWLERAAAGDGPDAARARARLERLRGRPQPTGT